MVTWFQSTRPRGARRQRLQRSSPESCFNPRAHGGRDQRHRKLRRRRIRFNPRAHGGRDTSRLRKSRMTIASFNPRAHGGRDSGTPRRQRPRPVSIHAPTGGATSRVEVQDAKELRFQSTRPRGARPDIVIFGADRRGFNPRAHGGRDPCGQPSIAAALRFQSTRPRGARLSHAAIRSEL